MPFNTANSVPSVLAQSGDTAAEVRTALEIALPHPGLIKDGSTLYGPMNTGGVGTVALTADTLYAIPCYTPEACTIEALLIGVTTLSAGAARLGVYSNSAGVPTDLLLDAGTVDTGGTGDKEISSLTLAIRPGWFWLVLVANATPTVRTLSFARQMILGSTGVAQSSTTHYTRSFTYGTLPSTFGSPTASSGSSAPSILWRPAQ